MYAVIIELNCGDKQWFILWDLQYRSYGRGEINETNENKCHHQSVSYRHDILFHQKRTKHGQRKWSAQVLVKRTREEGLKEREEAEKNLKWKILEQHHRNKRNPRNDMFSFFSSLDSEYKSKFHKDHNAKESTVTDGRSHEINPTFACSILTIHP